MVYANRTTMRKGTTLSVPLGAYVEVSKRN